MKYTTEITINQPIDKVVELFDNPNNLSEWQPELVSYEHIHGEPGQPGAEAKLKYKMGNRELEMIETVTRRDLPEEFAATYQADNVTNIQINHFETVGENDTKWISENEFQFKGFMKIMSWFMGGAFKKQTNKYMTQFKAFAERQ